MTRDADLERTKRLTREEAAEYLRCAPQTMRGWAAKQMGPKFAIVAGKALYRRDDLEAWVEAHEVAFGGDAA